MRSFYRRCYRQQGYSMFRKAVATHTDFLVQARRSREGKSREVYLPYTKVFPKPYDVWGPAVTQKYKLGPTAEYPIFKSKIQKIFSPEGPRKNVFPRPHCGSRCPCPRPRCCPRNRTCQKTQMTCHTTHLISSSDVLMGMFWLTYAGKKPHPRKSVRVA